MATCCQIREENSFRDGFNVVRPISEVQTDFRGSVKEIRDINDRRSWDSVRERAHDGQERHVVTTVTVINNAPNFYHHPFPRLLPTLGKSCSILIHN